MNELSLIPFGLRLSDQQFVDVSEVERGRKCDCICPSCKTPLIARQGEVNQWCFAHVSKGVSKETKNECEYSFWVSIILMAKQVIATAESISLPSLIMYTNDARAVTVTEQKEVLLTNVEIEKKLNSVSMDATLQLGEYVIAVIFTAPHRHIDVDYFIPDIKDSDKVGLLEISLLDAYQWLFGSDNQGKYTQVLKLNILSNVDCKKWLYHPRKIKLEKHHNADLYENKKIVDLKVLHPRQYWVEHKKYKCLMCKHNWFGTNKCINCNTHLYSTSQ